MSVSGLLLKLAFFPRSLMLRARIASARSLLHGPDAWHVLDRLGIPGHGTDLLRVDFQPRVADASRWDTNSATHARLDTIVARSLPAARALLSHIVAHAPARNAWPETADPARPCAPTWDNLFLLPVDMLALYGLVRELQPSRYLEIGSGMSTRVAHAAKLAGQLATEIISIDPSPRVEVEALCNRAIRGRLEDNTAELLRLARSADVVFFDGSHRALPGSDVTVFFLEVLPALPPGCIVHIHDIHLPADYPAPLLPRLWSEQYLLAAWLLGGGAGFEIILPNAALCSDAAARATLANVPALKGAAPVGSSFWLRRV